MAITIMASNSSPTSLQLKLHTSKQATIPITSKPRTITIAKPSFIRIMKSISLSTAAIAAYPALPALAEQMEKAKLFDFNLTLPLIAIEFLLLMVALDKIYFTPLGKFMDERDAAIRGKLTDVKDVSEEVKQLEEQAAAVMKAARAEISAALNQMKKETTAELEQKLAEGRKRVEAELNEALQNLEKQKDETIKALDAQIAALSDQIVKKVLPTA